MRNLVIMLISGCFAFCLYPSLGEAQHYRSGLPKQAGHLKKSDQRQQFRNQYVALLRLKSLKGDLAVTEEQKSELKNLRYEFKKTQIDHQADIKKANLELMYLKRDEAASKEAVMNAIDRVANAKAEMQKLQYSHRLDVRSVLTEEQLKELKSNRNNEDRIRKRQGARHQKLKRRFNKGSHRGI